VPTKRKPREVPYCLFCGVRQDKTLYSRCAPDAERLGIELVNLEGIEMFHHWVLSKITLWQRKK